jgi:hypothetical protein
MRKSLSFLFLLSLLVACLPGPGKRPSQTGSQPDQHPWGAALRALDPADSSSPAHDLTAVYLRQAGDQLQIRVDLLDFQNADDLSLEVKIGDGSTPGADPFTVHIPPVDSPAGIRLDPLLATVIIEVPSSEIPSRPDVDVSTPEDEIIGLALDGPVPAQTAPLLLTFYDTFAARFPAEALRSWDGAHSGPRGERHGLKHLLEAAEEYQVPLVLLDLKAPENLSALDAMGLLPQIQQMEGNGLLVLPDGPEQGILFGFSPSPFTWGGIPLRGTLPSRPTFMFLNDPGHIYRPLFSKTTFIPIASATGSTQPTPHGPPLEVRRALLDLAFNADKTDLLALGGSLEETTWGSPGMAGATLAYFASRPYIRILGANDLTDFPSKTGKSDLQSLVAEDPINELETHYRNLTQPVLEFIASWQGSPLSSCNSDFDKDGQPECVLANEGYLAIFDPQGARLSYLFSVGRVDNPPHTQLVGPSWQVAVGLSTPSLWDLSAGEAADPGVYPGAFADVDGPFKPYEPAVAGNTLVFSSPDGSREKTFVLTETGLEVQYQTQEPTLTHIPLLVEPDSRFTPGWAEQYVQKKTPGGVAWGLENGPMVNVQTEDAALSLPAPVERSGPGPKGVVAMRAFNESLSWLSRPEDPNFDYPPGHTIPFPLAVVEVEMQDGYFLRLERLP